MSGRGVSQFFTALLAVAAFFWMGAVFAQTDLGPTLSKIQRNGTIYLGHREGATPFSYIQNGDEGEVPQGFSWDICQKVVDGIRERLGRPDLKVVPLPLVAASRIMMVKLGIADLECGVTTNTRARQKMVSFSNTFFVAQVKIMVKRDSGIQSLKDLNGKTIAFTSGTSADRLIKLAVLARNMTSNYVACRDSAASMELLRSGEAQAYVADDGVLYGQRAVQSDPAEFVVLADGLSIEPYGLMMRKDDPQFKALVDGVIAKLMQSGEFEAIYKKWFLEPVPPTNVVLDLPISDTLRSLMNSPNDKPAF